MSGTSVTILNRNPIIVGDYDGPTLRITIGKVGLLLSFSKKVLERGLKNIKGLILNKTTT